jgi:AGZA family xanthine/uracil permease-like MFS transporter
MKNLLYNFFQLKKLNTNIPTEIISGIVTFMTMAYIIFVNPAILSNAWIPRDSLVIATCLAAGITTFLMGIITNYPLALAPGMGLNAFITYSIIIGMKLNWQTAMNLIVFEGIIITILVLTNVRVWIMNAIPVNIKKAIGVGIGLLIAFIGLQYSGIVIRSESTMVSFGNLDKTVALSLLGLIFTVLLLMKNVRGSILIGIIVTAFFCYILGISNVPKTIVAFPTASHFSTIFSCFSLKYLLQALNPALFSIVFALMLTDFFDTMGTVVAVCGKAGFLDKNGNLPRLKSVLFIDSIAAVIGGAFGCSSVTTYIESASGVSQGGKSGLTSVITAILFFFSIFFWPVITAIPQAATAPALIIVGFLMISLVYEINWENLCESFPAFIAIITIPLTFSISRGIGYSFISYTLLKILSGNAKQVHPAMYIISVLFAFDFILPLLK